MMAVEELSTLRPTVTVVALAVDATGAVIQGIRPRLISGTVGTPITPWPVRGYEAADAAVAMPATGGQHLRLTYLPQPQTVTVTFIDGAGGHPLPALTLRGVSDSPLPRAAVLAARRTLTAAGYRIINDDTFGAQFAREGHAEYSVLVAAPAHPVVKRHWWQSNLQGGIQNETAN